ncbi:MAG: type IV fimbrial biogenesis protein FimT [Rhodoferax sp.]|jgi:type IV fimbrial biogenesis protein FimT
MIELLVVLAVSAILLATALPSFSSWLQASRLRGAADVLSSHLRLVMTESTQLGDDVLLSFQQDSQGANWCYGLNLSTPCDCHVDNACQINKIERVIHGRNFSGILLNPTHTNYRFKPRRSTVTAGSIMLTAANGRQLKVVVSGYGRIRLCSPKGSSYLSGQPFC